MYTFVTRNITIDDALGPFPNEGACISAPNSTSRAPECDIHPLEQPGLTHPSRVQIVLGVTFLSVVLIIFGCGLYIVWKKLINSECPSEGKPELGEAAASLSSEESEYSTKKKPSSSPKLLALDDLSKAHSVDTLPNHSKGYSKVCF